jgi:hypothetical protein
MKITGHRTGSVFERYNITDETDTQEAGRKGGRVSGSGTGTSGTNGITKAREGKLKGRRINPLFCAWCGEGDLNPHGVTR